jgi:hypothetical protein
MLYPGALALRPFRRVAPMSSRPLRQLVGPAFKGSRLGTFARRSRRRAGPRENSGSITVNTELGNPQLAVVWERRRNGPIAVRARSLGSLPLPETRDFFDQIMERCRSGATDRVYRRGSLQYWGLAWRGELWLDDTVRLGPPSRHDERSVTGPRIVHADAMLDIINPTDVPHVLRQRFEELSAFLSVMMTDDVLVEVQGRAWTSTQGAADCAVRNLGYYETENPTQMPQRGACRSMPLWPLDGPPAGIDGITNELSLRADVIELWTIYSALPVDRQRQFLQVAAKFQEAMIHWKDRRTLSFALMVVACEGLKPKLHEHNVYHVIEALLGKATAERLRQQLFPPQSVRSTHLHTGEFHSSEFLQRTFMPSYEDPTFDEKQRELTKITQQAIVEWLRRRGKFAMPMLKRRKTARRSRFSVGVRKGKRRAVSGAGRSSRAR